MASVTITRRVHFNAAHRLHSATFSDEENARLYGPCNNPNFHGHNYELDVSVKGEIDTATGYVADLGIVRDIVKERVVARLDHKNLNLDVAEFQNLVPTAENIVVVIWRMLEGHLPGQLERLVLWETPRNYVEYIGDE